MVGMMVREKVTRMRKVDPLPEEIYLCARHCVIE